MTPGTQAAELPTGIQQELRDARSTAFDHLDAMAAVLDESGVVVDTNEAWRLFTDLNGGSIKNCGTGVDYLQVCDRAAASGSDDAALVAGGLRRILDGECSRFDLEYRGDSPTEGRWFLLRAFAIAVDNGVGVMVLHDDVTARRQLECRLAECSELDELTGLPNRRSVLALLDEQLAFAGLYDAAVSVVHIALTGLHEVRESSGQHLGDALLTKMAARLGRTIRTGDVVARISTTEFVLVCPGAGEIAAHATADRLSVVLPAPLQIGFRQFSVDVSIGVVTAREPGCAEQLIEAAGAEVHPGRQDPQINRVSPTQPALADSPDADGVKLLVGRSPESVSDTASEAMLEASLSHSSDVALFQRADGTIVWASPTVRSVFGIDPKDLIGRNGAELVHVDDRNEAFAAFRGIGGRGESARFRFRVLNHDGDVRWVEEIATNLLDEPDVGAIVCNLRDITDQLRARETADRLSAIVESSSDAILSKTLDGIITTFNPGAEALFGYAAQEVLGRHVNILAPAGEEEEIEGFLERVRTGEQIKNVVSRRQRADGSILHVLLSVSPVLDDSGSVVGAASIAQDLTEVLHLQERIESERARLADAQRVAHLGSFEVDLADGGFSCSEELCRILGFDGTEHPVRLIDHVHADDRVELLDAVDQVIAGEMVARRTHRIVRPGGDIRWVETRMTPFREAGSTKISGVVLDVTESHTAKEALAYQATHDRLTGLTNRAGMHEALLRMVTDVSDGSGYVAVALMDLDQFKVINDSFGHDFGDQVIELLAERLVGALDANHVIARFGGDEFMVARSGVDDLSAAHTLAQLSQEVLAEPFVIGGRSVLLRASAGVAISERGSTAESLIRDADTAKFQAKEDGRACTRTYDSTARRRAARRLMVETALSSALSNGELHVEYQPVVSLEDGRTTGFEALARWSHPELGRIAPDEFIPIAEQAGLILPIGQWVLGEALRQLASWRAGGQVASGTRLAVNLSTVQLSQSDLVERVQDAISLAGVPPELLQLEITETMLLDRVDIALDVISALRELGVSISIDDFGTGFSSLSYVDRLPIDALKIDRSFVSTLGESGDDSIVRAIAALADSLDLDVIAEGIETPEQLAVLQRLGIGFGQGFLWTPPVAAWEAAKWAASPDSAL